MLPKYSKEECTALMDYLDEIRETDLGKSLHTLRVLSKILIECDVKTLLRDNLSPQNTGTCIAMCLYQIAAELQAKSVASN